MSSSDEFIFFFNIKLDTLPPMWPHPTPEDHDLANLNLHYPRILPHKSQLFWYDSRFFLFIFYVKVSPPIVAPHYSRGQWLEQFEFLLSEVSFPQVSAFLVKYFLSRKLHLLHSFKKYISPIQRHPSLLFLFLTKPRDTCICKLF